MIPATNTLPKPWQAILKQDQKCFFSSYVYLEPGLRMEFHYRNIGIGEEEVVPIFFHRDGRQVEGVSSQPIILHAGETLVLDAGALLNAAGYTSFQGSIMCVVHAFTLAPDEDLAQRDFVCVWSSAKSGRPACHIGLGALKTQNVTGRKEKQSYYMFCPVVVSTQNIKTVIPIFNHSTEPGYADSITFRPVLHNQKGEVLTGKEVSAPPFGTFLIDVDEVFGEAGRALLSKTDGRGTVTAIHSGHTFVSLFFHVDRHTKEIVSGTHTNPAIGILYPYGVLHYWFNRLAEYNPIFYFIWWLKHIRSSSFFRILYPPRPLMLNSPWHYVRQSRWVLQLEYLTRAFYFLLCRGFKLDIIQISEGTTHNAHVIEHNLWANLNLFHFSRARVEHLLYLLALVPANLSGRTLCIGPRNEGETLLFRRHGFKDVIGIDLFTYSPDILLMDVHSMSFPDNTFDTINCGWVLTYCYDVSKAAREIIRVSKDGALIACSFTVPRRTDSVPSQGAAMEQGVNGILALFGDSVKHVFWRDDDVQTPGSKIHLIFRIKKSILSGTK